MKKCVCQSGLDYAVCCEPYHNGHAFPKSVESLMRSRYSAYVMANIDYITQTMRGKAAEGYDKFSAKKWAERVSWLSLSVHRVKQDNDCEGYVEFTATYLDQKSIQMIHELSEFHLIDGRWFYVDGKILPPLKIGRNQPCPCGSLKKFKHCHGKS